MKCEVHSHRSRDEKRKLKRMASEESVSNCIGASGIVSKGIRLIIFSWLLPVDIRNLCISCYCDVVHIVS